MNSSLLVSIVVPSFNQAPFLEECLASVLDQTYPRREVIVIDGGRVKATSGASSSMSL